MFWVRQKDIIMRLIPVSFLLLEAVMLAQAHLPSSANWMSSGSPEMYQMQDFLSHGSRMTPRGYNSIEPGKVLNAPQPPDWFYPRGFREKQAESPVKAPVQTPVQNPVQMLVEHPVQDPVSALASDPNPPAWNLVQTPVPASVHKPVLVPEPAPNHLPLPAQNLPMQSGPNSVLVPTQDPGTVPVPAQNPQQLSGPSTGLGPAYGPSYTPVPVPTQNIPLSSGLNSVVVPAQDPVQNLQQLSGPSTGVGPAQDLGYNQSQAPGLSPALTSGLSAVLLNTSKTSAWNADHSVAQAPQLTLPNDPLKALQLQVPLPTKPKKLMWQFPKAPERPKQPPVQFDLRQPTPVSSVAAACGESAVHVEVKQDFFGNGQLINPSSLTLGGCAAAALDSAARVLIFHSELQACGSVLMMMEDYLIYRFNLLYHPEPLVGTPIVRTGSVNVQIECHYSRKHNVSSNAVAPTWVPYSSTVAAEEHLVFTLKLMTDDWKYERPSNQYFLGEFMNIEASLTPFNHAPLRVSVDRCVATAVPDVNAVPRYSFIENHGCLIDAKITGSKSQFMKRVQDDKLQFQLEVFRFEQGNSSALYITCFLKGSTALRKSDAEHKACSFTANGWSAADGNDQDCNCCDAECPARKARSVPTDEDQCFETEVSLGPILIED